VEFQACDEDDPELAGHELDIESYMRATPIAILYFRA
jgi:hypothetical protein